ncbi:hypothetical protein I5I77_33735, partial [Pseudomonas aeruginosa]|nr:hypothetical protein [Pseudomonas aeruginosa]
RGLGEAHKRQPEINTLNQEGVENLQATLRACGELENQAGRLRQLVDSFKI